MTREYFRMYDPENARVPGVILVPLSEFLDPERRLVSPYGDFAVEYLGPLSDRRDPSANGQDVFEISDREKGRIAQVGLTDGGAISIVDAGINWVRVESIPSFAAAEFGVQIDKIGYGKSLEIIRALSRR